jgi:iron complex outermembrane receptor protein
MRRVICAPALIVGLCAPTIALAQPSEPASSTSEAAAAEQPGTASDAMEAYSQDIVVTGTKRVGGELLQKTPLAISALGKAQLDAKFVTTLSDIHVPNAQLVTGGAVAGYAGFSIRGLGINSTIASIDPAVGVFVDGIYMGIPAGLVLDNFDLESVEVLRGPQGLLFGKNVTGGAVVIRTTRPSFTFAAEGRARIETGLNKIVSGTVTGPLSSTIAAKLAMYYSDDNGWFRNKFDGSSLGKMEQFIVRPAIRFEPSDQFSIDLRFEHGKITGDGPTFQNQNFFKRGSSDVSNDYRGYTDQKRDQAVAEINAKIAGGTLTNIAGYRRFHMDSGFDTDGSPNPYFHFVFNAIRQDQFSNELRYARTLGPVEATIGAYYFEQNLKSVEQRSVFGGLQVTSGGGKQKTETYAIFGSFDWHVTDQFTLNVGGRQTWERKSANITVIQANGCNTATLVCIGGFSDSNRWRGFTPKVGLQWEPTNRTLLYGYYTRGFRSGGYNIRHSSFLVAPGPYDDEKTDSFEVGAKQSFGGGTRLNVALFNNKIHGMQREIQFATGTTVAQVIRNTAVATLRGFEAEGQVVLTPNLVVDARVGYVKGKYNKILFDISGDGLVNGTDLDLKIPRLVPWTYGAGIAYSLPIDAWDSEIVARVDFEHRDLAFQTDNNLATLPGADLLDASLTFSLHDHFKFSVFGKNLLNEITFGNHSPLPAAFGGPGASSATLNKGRILGAEISFKY